MTQSHCKSSPGSSSARWPPILRPSQLTWAVNPPIWLWSQSKCSRATVASVMFAGICVTCQPLDILAVGHESSLLQRLLCYGASFSTRHIRHSATASHLTASAVADKHGSASVFVEDEFSLSVFLACSQHIVLYRSLFLVVEVE